MNLFDIALAKKLSGGGGSGVTVEELNVTENGIYSEDGVAYSPVNVDVSGGGPGAYDLLGKFSLGEINYDQYNVAAYVGSYSVTNAYDYDLITTIISRDTAPTGEWQFIATAQSALLITQNNAQIAGASSLSPLNLFYAAAGGAARTNSSSSKYGVYVNGYTLTAGGADDNGKLDLAVYKNYYSTYGVISGNYTMRVYGLKLFDRTNKIAVM